MERQNKHRRKLPNFVEGQLVLIYVQKDKKWVKAKILKSLSRCTYLVWCMDRVKFVHSDNMKLDSAQRNQVDLDVSI